MGIDQFGKPPVCDQTERDEKVLTRHWHLEVDERLYKEHKEVRSLLADAAMMLASLTVTPARRPCKFHPGYGADDCPRCAVDHFTDKYQRIDLTFGSSDPKTS